MAARRIHTYFIDRESPTPLIMYTVQQYGLYYGIAVTASHNPALYNGIKLFTKGGRDAVQEITDELSASCAGIRAEDIPAMPFEKALKAG